MGEYEKATDYLAQALELALRNNQRTGTLYYIWDCATM